jgi:hypothetical protein
MRSNEQMAVNNGKQKIREELRSGKRSGKNRSRTHEARAQKPATKSRGGGTRFKTSLHADE